MWNSSLDIFRPKLKGQNILCGAQWPLTALLGPKLFKKPNWSQSIIVFRSSSARFQPPLLCKGIFSPKKEPKKCPNFGCKILTCQKWILLSNDFFRKMSNLFWMILTRILQDTSFCQKVYVDKSSRCIGIDMKYVFISIESFWSLYDVFQFGEIHFSVFFFSNLALRQKFHPIFIAIFCHGNLITTVDNCQEIENCL